MMSKQGCSPPRSTGSSCPLCRITHFLSQFPITIFDIPHNYLHYRFTHDKKNRSEHLFSMRFLDIPYRGRPPVTGKEVNDDNV